MGKKVMIIAVRYTAKSEILHKLYLLLTVPLLLTSCLASPPAMKNPRADCAESGSSCYLEDQDFFIPCCDSLESCRPWVMGEPLTATCKQEDCAARGSPCLLNNHYIRCCHLSEACIPFVDENGEMAANCGHL